MNISDSSSSEEIRKSQQYEVDALYTPLSQYILSYGASASYSLNPNFKVGLTYLQGKKSVDISDSTVTAKGDLTGMAVNIQARYFLSNSFNLSSGLGYRAANIKYNVADTVGNHVEGELKISSITIPFFIGNSWTWESGFTLGCDWIGVFIPLSGSSKGSTTGNLSSSTITDLNSDFVEMGDKLAKKASLTLALTSIGWAF
jgi:hypothetical protein